MENVGVGMIKFYLDIVFRLANTDPREVQPDRPIDYKLRKLFGNLLVLASWGLSSGLSPFDKVTQLRVVRNKYETNAHLRRMAARSALE